VIPPWVTAVQASAAWMRAGWLRLIPAAVTIWGLRLPARVGSGKAGKPWVRRHLAIARRSANLAGAGGSDPDGPRPLAGIACWQAVCARLIYGDPPPHAAIRRDIPAGMRRRLEIFMAPSLLYARWIDCSRAF
jgi:hypothetical protein